MSAYEKFESILLQQTVRLSRDFSFLYRKVGRCRGVRGPGGQHGRQRREGLVNITPIAGNVSVGRYSSTAVPARRFATWLHWCAEGDRVSDVTKL